MYEKETESVYGKAGERPKWLRKKVRLHLCIDDLLDSSCANIFMYLVVYSSRFCMPYTSRSIRVSFTAALQGRA